MDLLERTSIIGEIARLKQGGQLGKTAVMKLLHLLQDGLGVPLGYRFTLYNYGPYQSEVMSDIEFAESLNRVTVNYLGPDQGYRITPGSDVGKVPQDIEPKLKELIRDFGTMNARELELRSTLLFLSRSYSGQQLINRLRELKPKYSESEATVALDDLHDKGLAISG
ncbi:MAG TPA: hypothetical protein VFE47_02900 [Tepidisphaeraceae bacterium]|nr:hypothetical protein [Tepidisphaeraceae bacterium]